MFKVHNEAVIVVHSSKFQPCKWALIKLKIHSSVYVRTDETPHSPCHKLSHLANPLPLLWAWRNYWMAPNKTNVLRL